MRVKHFKRLPIWREIGWYRGTFMASSLLQGWSLFIIPGQKVQKIVRACTIRLWIPLVVNPRKNKGEIHHDERTVEGHQRRGDQADSGFRQSGQAQRCPGGISWKKGTADCCFERYEGCGTGGAPGCRPAGKRYPCFH